MQLLQNILTYREYKARIIAETIKQSRLPLIELTLNTPGAIKDSTIYTSIHIHLVHQVLKCLQEHGFSYQISTCEYTSSGPFVLLSHIKKFEKIENSCLFDKDQLTTADYIKALMTKIEESSALARLYDIDVFDPDFGKLQRKTGMRTCLLCNQPAVVCARTQTHTYAELTVFIRNTFLDTYNCMFHRYETSLDAEIKQFAVEIGCKAQKALLTEVLLTPKPGLVDQKNQGAHTDMNLETFFASTAALGEVFSELFLAGYIQASCHEGSIDGLLPVLKGIGLRGETVMYETTQGINTHKGLIFSIGILCGTLGWYVKRNFTNSKEYDYANMQFSRVQLTELQYLVQELCANLVTNELTALGKKQTTYGEDLYQRYKCTGARGEAEKGFPSAFSAMDMLLSLLSSQYISNDVFENAALQTLMVIMKDFTDTNVLGRADMSGLHFVQQSADSYIAAGGVYTDSGFEKLSRIDKEFIEKHISPGGAADTLATAFFLMFLHKHEKTLQIPIMT